MKSSKKTPAHGNGTYKFDPTTVKDAKEVPGAARKCADQQEGTNLSSLPKTTPPGGSKKEE
jgi:hypothetical protein